jgi:hypothetical protein
MMAHDGFVSSTQNCKGLQMIDPVKADTIDAQAADCSGNATFGSPDRNRRQPLCGLAVSATLKD